MPINWGLGQGPNAFDKAFGTGMQLGQAARRQQGENALAAYAIDQNDENFANVAKYHPRIAMQEKSRMAEAQKQQQFIELRKAALSGDKAAQVELAAQDTAAYNAMSKEQRDQVDQQDDALAQAAFQIMRAPPEQRAAIWDEQAKNLGADQYVGQYSDAMLNTIVNRAGIQERLQKFNDPSYMAIPEGGTLVNTRDPSAIAQFGGQQPAQQGLTKEQGQEVVTNWKRAGYATRDQIETIKRSMGGNQQAVDQFIQNQGLAVVDATQQGPDGKTYFLINGKVYDNPRGE